VLVVLVAGQSGQWRSRTAATVAGTQGLQRADAVPEMVARMLGRGARLSAVSSGLWVRRGGRMQEIGRGRDEFRRWAKGRAEGQFVANFGPVFAKNFKIFRHFEYLVTYIKH